MAILHFSTIKGPIIVNSYNPKTGIVVCIPVYQEKEVNLVIENLLNCTRPPCHVEIIVLINESENELIPVSIEHRKLYDSLRILAQKIQVTNGCYTLYPIYVKNIPHKKAGVGQARKIAMDEAVVRLSNSVSQLKIICSCDADSIYSSNYFLAIWSFFKNEHRKDACSIYFEHPLQDSNDPKLVMAITKYELHLRYYKNMRALIGLPFAYYTIGSSMAVRCKAYEKAGGMNTRKAAEDFYFLQKFIKNNTCGELLSTTVYPSGRISTRVPFGTGKAIHQILQDDMRLFTYHPDSFYDYKIFTDNIHNLYGFTNEDELSDILVDLPLCVQKFLLKMGGKNKIKEIKRNSASFSSFKKRFYQTFDAFNFMKYLHFSRDHFYENMEVGKAVAKLFEKLSFNSKISLTEMLLRLRRMDKYGQFESINEEQAGSPVDR